MSEPRFTFKSSLNIFFYFGTVFILLILGFTCYKLSSQQLNFGSFVFLNFIALMMGYVFALRFSCRIHLTENAFEITYYFKDEKKVYIPTEEIVSFEKHADTVHRYFKKLQIVTSKATFLIRYNISESSDEDMLNLLRTIAEENKLRLMRLSEKSS